MYTLNAMQSMYRGELQLRTQQSFICSEQHPGRPVHQSRMADTLMKQ